MLAASFKAFLFGAMNGGWEHMFSIRDIDVFYVDSEAVMLIGLASMVFFLIEIACECKAYSEATARQTRRRCRSTTR